MLAAVFFCQPLGQLSAVLMAYAATAGFKSYIASAPVAKACSVLATDLDGQECARTVDRAWRLVAGLGAVPAAVAIIFRLTIPESVSLCRNVDRNCTYRHTDHQIQVYYSLDIKNDSNEAMQAKEYFGSEEDLGLDRRHSVLTHESRNLSSGLGATIDSKRSDVANDTATHHPQPALRHKASIQPDSNEIEPGVTVVDMLNEDPHRVLASRADFYKYLFIDKNWTELFATSANWMLLDFTFFMLGVNSSSFVPTIFGKRSSPLTSPYVMLVRNERHIMMSTSIGALVGSALAIGVIHYYSRRKIQTWGFLGLGVLFVVVGALYITLPTTNAHVAIVVFYGICQLSYNLGLSSSFRILSNG